MNLKKCERQHYYNGDKFAACPYCAAKGKKAEITWKVKKEQEPEEQRGLKDAVSEAFEQKYVQQFQPKQMQNQGEFLPFGLLVVLNGEEKGTLLPLYFGKENYLLYENGKVKMIAQKTAGVCASFHANPDHKSFYVSMEAELGEVMVGRVVVTGAVPIEAYDNLQIAACNVMFVPICGAHFWW